MIGMLVNVVHRQGHKNIQQTNHSTSLTLKDGHGAEVTNQSLGVAVFDLIWFTFERSFKV